MKSFYSIKTQIVSVTVLIVVLTVLAITGFLQFKIERNLQNEQKNSAVNVVNSLLFSVENHYQNVKFYEEAITVERKRQLENIVTVAIGITNGWYSQYIEGVVTEEKAKAESLRELSALRYQNGVGYIWINDTSSLSPMMIMHPTQPELDGTVLDSPEYDCARGVNQNLFVAIIDETKHSGEGYVDYLWPKPLPGSLSVKQPKISFVKRFYPWGWILGTGLYIDDIESSVDARIESIKNELKIAINDTKIMKTGYAYIFNSDMDVIAHPVYRADELKGLKNPMTGNDILVDIISANESGIGYVDYLWDKPLSKGQFRFEKRSYVRYFEPLDWYIATSVYKDDINKPIQDMRKDTLVFSLSLLIIVGVLSFLFATRFTSPLKKIIALSTRGALGEYSHRLNFIRKDEIGVLATNFDNFMCEIENSHTHLIDSEEKFRTLFENANDAQLIIKTQRIVSCNSAAVKMLECPDSQYLLNKTLIELSPEFQEDLSRSISKFEEIELKFIEQGVILFEWSYIKYSGEHSIASVELTLIDELVHVRLRDITEQKKIAEEKKRTEEQLVQMQKMETVGTLAGGFAHDFNNILSGIVGTISLIRFTLEKDGAIDRSELEEEIEIMEQSGDRAEKMVSQLLTLSRKQTLTFESVNLNDSISNVVKLASASLDKSVDIVIHTPDTPSITTADAAQVEQVILNFCVNGSHAMTIMRGENEKWGGKLSISIEGIVATKEFCSIHSEANIGKYWCVSISDSGIGMSKSTIAKIFTPFFTTKDKGIGTGLGLSMVYSIVKDHGGFIYVYSELGKGTSFDIYFPRIDDDKEVAVSSKNTEIQEGSGTILVIDDEKVMRNMADKMLSRIGYTVIMAEDGEKGIEIYREKMDEISLVILDMAMPGLSGKETFVSLKEIDEDVNVLLASGFQQDSRVQSILSLGVKGFISKPYNIFTLTESVKKVLLQ